jgi:hypothetical protein
LKQKPEEKAKKINEYIDLYTDFLISQFGYATATGLSATLDNEVSHDQITRFLKNSEFTSKDLYVGTMTIQREKA